MVKVKAYIFNIFTMNINIKKSCLKDNTWLTDFFGSRNGFQHGSILLEKDKIHQLFNQTGDTRVHCFFFLGDLPCPFWYDSSSLGAFFWIYPDEPPEKQTCLIRISYSQRTYKFAIFLTILVLRTLPLTLSGKESFLNILGVKDVI